MSQRPLPVKVELLNWWVDRVNGKLWGTRRNGKAETIKLDAIIIVGLPDFIQFTYGGEEFIAYNLNKRILPKDM